MAITIFKKKSDLSIWYTDFKALNYFSLYKELFQIFHILKEPAEINIAEGTAIETEKATIRITVIEENNKEIVLNLNNVIYVPNMLFNLFSLMAAYYLKYKIKIMSEHDLRILHNEVLVAQMYREQGDGSGSILPHHIRL